MVLLGNEYEFGIISEAITLVFDKSKLLSCSKHTTVLKYVDKAHRSFLIV
jgi:hypothetical protein